MPIVSMSFSSNTPSGLDRLVTKFFKDEGVRKEDIINASFALKSEFYFITNVLYFSAVVVDVDELHQKYVDEATMKLLEALDEEVDDKPEENPRI